MRVNRHSVAPWALPGMVIDLFLCFVALLLAASTLTTRYATIHGAVPELPLILVGATIFALVMAAMYAIVGLYRPTPISLPSTVGRTAFALVVGAYVTSLILRTVADRGYIDGVIPPSHTRGYIARALRLLTTKREAAPARKHGNIPL